MRWLWLLLLALGGWAALALYGRINHELATNEAREAELSDWASAAWDIYDEIALGPADD